MQAEGAGRPEAYLQLTNLASGYGSSRVVSDVSARVGLGEIATFIGPNGSGKSTLLKAITGGLPVMEGSVTLGGRDVTNLRRDLLVRLGVGYVPQEKEVFNSLTVRENLRMGGSLLRKAEVGTAMDRVLSIFPALAPLLRAHAGKLSGGERKMLALGRILMIDPRLVILDEPSANLSPVASKQVLGEQVPALAASGTAVMLVEQRAIQALEVSDWAYVMVGGRVRLEGSAPEVRVRGDIGELFLGRQPQALRGLETQDAEG